MFFKSALLASLALLSSQSLAADDCTIGTLLAYTQTSYNGNPVILSVVNGTTEFCQVWENIGSNNAAFPNVKSYIAADLACFTFPTKDCSGNSNGIFSGDKTNVNRQLGSLFCGYASN